MTPLQHHFPYFIELSKFNADLAQHHWMAHIVTSQGKNESESILLVPMDINVEYERESPSLRFDFGTFLMVQSHMLYA